MQKAYDKIEISNISKLNIKKIMNPWTELTCYPTLIINQRKNTLIVMPHIVSQCYSDLYKDLDIFITATKESAPDFTISIKNSTKYFVKWISLKYRFNIYYFPHDSNEWIIFNLQQVGKYYLLILRLK